VSAPFEMSGATFVPSAARSAAGLVVVTVGRVLARPPKALLAPRQQPGGFARRGEACRLRWGRRGGGAGGALTEGSAEVRRMVASNGPGKVAESTALQGEILLGQDRTPVVLAALTRGVPEQLRSAVRDAAEAVTDFSWLSRGDPVFIKPACNSGKPYPATTSPVAVAAMIELLKERGAGRVIVGDMSGIQYVSFWPGRGCPGGRRRAVRFRGSRVGRLSRRSAARGFPLDAGADDAQHPRGGGAHCPHAPLRLSLAGRSLARLEAAVGYWRRDTRLEYHRVASSFYEKTAEGNTVDTLLTKQRLVLTAADKTLAGFGPDDGWVCQPRTGLVIASESVVAHDMVSLAWLILSGEGMPLGVRQTLRASSLLTGFANRVVVGFLSDWRTALASETLSPNPVESVGGDRVLNRAYQVLGGRPELDLRAANDLVPDDLRERLGEMVAPPDD